MLAIIIGSVTSSWCLIEHILFYLFSLGIKWQIADHIFVGFLLLVSLTMNFLFVDFYCLLTLFLCLYSIFFFSGLMGFFSEKSSSFG